MYPAQRADVSEPVWSVAIAAAIAVAVGIAVGISPLLAAALTGGAVGVVVLLVMGRRFVGGSLIVLAALLTGYVLFGRGLAHVGAAPAYVSEITLAVVAIGVLGALGRGRLSWLHGVVLLFMLLGALQTIPYLGRYGIDAVRDAVTWGYALFALAVSLMLTRPWLEAAVGWYGRVLLPVFVLWVPVAAIVFLTIGSAFPAGPGSEIPLVYFKGGDMGVHLAGIGAFVLLAVDQRTRRVIPEPIFWVLWLADVLLVGVITRGGMFAALMAFGAFLFAPSAQRFGRPLVIGAILFLAVALVNPTVDLGIERRLSLGQVIDNVTSILSDRGETGVAEQLQGTKNFRLKWWTTIADYTVGGPYFWTGKGFGINLADADGFQVTPDHALRSPHNAHVEVLARMGVPGLVVWIVLNVGWAAAVFRRWLADRVRDPFPARIAAWLLVYWAAMLVNASFDPYLQGPQGGIWYWTVIGAGIFLVTSPRRDAEEEGVPVVETGSQAPGRVGDRGPRGTTA